MHCPRLHRFAACVPHPEEQNSSPKKGPHWRYRNLGAPSLVTCLRERSPSGSLILPPKMNPPPSTAKTEGLRSTRCDTPTMFFLTIPRSSYPWCENEGIICDHPDQIRRSGGEIMTGSLVGDGFSVFPALCPHTQGLAARMREVLNGARTAPPIRANGMA
jgi:hypothetical protein